MACDDNAIRITKRRRQEIKAVNFGSFKAFTDRWASHRLRVRGELFNLILSTQLRPNKHIESLCKYPALTGKIRITLLPLLLQRELNKMLTLAIASRTASSLNWLMKRAEDASGMTDICVNDNEKTWTIINTNLSIVAKVLLLRQLPWLWCKLMASVLDGEERLRQTEATSSCGWHDSNAIAANLVVISCSWGFARQSARSSWPAASPSN